MALDPVFWRNRRVFVTGHTGFKGGWLCLWLHSMGAEVHGYALNPPTDPSIFATAHVREAMTSSTIADIRDAKKLASTVKEAQPEIVFHLAAQPLVRHSYQNPIETYEVNEIGRAHV